MRVIQIVPSLLYGDAVGNDVLAFFDVLKKAGYETSVYSYSIDKRLVGEGIFSIDDIPSINDDDVVIYHMACGSELSFFFKDLTCKKMLIYHNITPPHFFELYDKHSERICGDGHYGPDKNLDDIQHHGAASGIDQPESGEDDQLHGEYDQGIDELQPVTAEELESLDSDRSGGKVHHEELHSLAENISSGISATV